ncbi:MAG: M48 family metallopeptidase [Cyclobacteriaceae bacterium]|jgi:predicted Zn-dependent protease|nr:M48 family metallopeptidase [Flammeovirgaceae bacterium]
MNRIIIQAVAIVAFFFGLYWGLSQVDWMTLFEVKKMTDTTEEKLGDLFWELYSKENTEINGRNAKAPLDSLVEKICKANGIDRKSIQLHIVKNDQINAFALPNGHLVVNSALILDSENESELCGVLGHEIAHIQLRHVMKKLVKEIGLSVLVSMTAGGGGETVKEAVKMLSSSAYDRTLEKEADLKSVDYLTAANINPEPFADFLYRMGDGEASSIKYLSWMSTHPDSKERAAYIVESIDKDKKDYQPVLANATWEKLKKYLEEE